MNLNSINCNDHAAQNSKTIKISLLLEFCCVFSGQVWTLRLELPFLDRF